jgi:hypothetical protein
MTDEEGKTHEGDGGNPQEGLETYLQHLGNISDFTIGDKYDINRQTVGRWRKTDRWQAILAETRQSTDKKIADKVSTSLVVGPDSGGKGGLRALEYANPVNQGERGKGGSRVPQKICPEPSKESVQGDQMCSHNMAFCSDKRARDRAMRAQVSS